MISKKIIQTNIIVTVVNILIIFILLFVINRLSKDNIFQNNTDLDIITENDSLKNINELNDRIKSKDILMTVAEIEKRKIEQKLFMNFKPDNVTFNTNSSELTQQGKDELELLSYFFNKPEYKNYGFIIKGYTDNVGSEKFNLILSNKRAKSIYFYLTTVGNIEENRLKYIGYGEANPIGDNTTGEGRQQNRRVEYDIFKIE